MRAKIRVLGNRDSIETALKVSIAFVVIAFLWSLLGFLSPTPSNFGEYTDVQIVNEVVGHIVFGLVVGAFSFDPALALVCGAQSILIDADHILEALNFPVIGRTAHSMFFAIVSSLLVASVVKKGRRVVLFAVTFASILAHLSYDTFAGGGIFPILAPINYSFFSFPYQSWAPLELTAVVIVLVARIRYWR